MKETWSESEWVGKLITCATCNRSFKIEAGDKIEHGYERKIGKSYSKRPNRFEMPCGHYWAIPKG